MWGPKLCTQECIPRQVLKALYLCEKTLLKAQMTRKFVPLECYSIRLISLESIQAQVPIIMWLADGNSLMCKDGEADCLDVLIIFSAVDHRYHSYLLCHFQKLLYISHRLISDFIGVMILYVPAFNDHRRSSLFLSSRFWHFWQNWGYLWD